MTRPHPLELLHDMVLAPARAFRAICYEQPRPFVLGCFGAAILAQTLTGALHPTGLPGKALPMAFLALALVWFFLLAGEAALLHLICEWLDGRGSVRLLFLLLAASLVPLAFSPPLLLASPVLGPQLTALGQAVLWTWVIFLQIAAIRYLYGFGALRAVVAYGLPAAAAAAALLLLLALAAALLLF